jgi:hypothetical protein
MATNGIIPPDFISGMKSYEKYKADLRLWSRLTTLDKKLQGEMVIYQMTDHLKRKMRGCQQKLISNENGVKDLLKFLDSMNKDDMADPKTKTTEVFLDEEKPTKVNKTTKVFRGEEEPSKVNDNDDDYMKEDLDEI